MIGGTLITLVGAVVLRLTLTDQYLRFVQSGMHLWLLLAGAALALLGLITVIRALRGEGEEHPREGWLVLAPVAVLLLVAPPALGSYGVDRGARLDIRAGHGEFEPLPDARGPIPMTLLEYGQRSFDSDGRTLRGATLELTGFVATGASGDSFRLARYQIACCAADAAAAVVKVIGVAGAPPPSDEWVTVTGHFAAPDGDDPVLAAVVVQPIQPPDDPYE